MSLSSEIIVPVSEELLENPRQDKLRTGYIAARKLCGFTDIELNRSRIVVLDEYGHIVKCTFVVEH
ncbi:hypothetical protein VR7878_03714 [Vibrio ruber DSM 16370]|uniref:Uncharacterized protein n=1 Tax=Vibrio ruber (strain DSM 16370 / JCM 11486 / BCRC 17186 / CECT 7878 / LMG 23124 / VR1) TaxID=1123498 RepID=A0A1R4LU13_VIBR1|nr:hypothetical protein [Vibrio ruber]SJN59817.1 hypothetical protein VR7878_03714 [Vibrio ruber DSM 16370]